MNEWMDGWMDGWKDDLSHAVEDAHVLPVLVQCQPYLHHLRGSKQSVTSSNTQSDRQRNIKQEPQECSRRGYVKGVEDGGRDCGCEGSDGEGLHDGQAPLLVVCSS